MFMNIAVRLNERFYQLIAFGLGVTYIFQVFLTIGGGTKFVPLTGVTLPLISYGGSSVLTTLMMFSIVEGLYVLRQKEIEEQRRLLMKKQKRTRSRSDKQEKKNRTKKNSTSISIEDWDDEDYDE